MTQKAGMMRSRPFIAFASRLELEFKDGWTVAGHCAAFSIAAMLALPLPGGSDHDGGKDAQKHHR